MALFYNAPLACASPILMSRSEWNRCGDGFASRAVRKISTQPSNKSAPARGARRIRDLVRVLDDMGAGAEEALGLGVRLALLEAHVGRTEDQGSNSNKSAISRSSR